MDRYTNIVKRDTSLLNLKVTEVDVISGSDSLVSPSKNKSDALDPISSVTNSQLFHKPCLDAWALPGLPWLFEFNDVSRKYYPKKGTFACAKANIYSMSWVRTVMNWTWFSCRWCVVDPRDLGTYKNVHDFGCVIKPYAYMTPLLHPRQPLSATPWHNDDAIKSSRHHTHKRQKHITLCSNNNAFFKL